MKNAMKTSALLTIIAEWLEQEELPPLIFRHQAATAPENLKRILAIVGPRRSGKTYYMYQLIGVLLQNGICSKEDILFIDFEDYRLSEFTGDHMDELFAAFQQLAGRPPP
jgi:predicted AAA+ superfamily ATPase